MSVKIMGEAWDLDLPASKLLVLLAMADHADHNGNNVYPSVELIAWKTGYSESQARRIMKALVKDGILSAQARPGRTTLYSVRLENGKKKAPFKRSNTGCQIETPVIAVTPQGYHSHDTPTPVIAVTPEPSLEPSDKPIAASAAKKTTPAALMNPMKDAIAAAFQYKWETMSKPEKNLVQLTAKELCEAGVIPSEVPALYAYCKGRFSNFKPRALSTNVSDWRKSTSGNVSVLDGLRLVS